MSSPTSETPMMVQYRALKAEHPDCLLFFRLGDFYEMFFEDAQAAAPALDIALTRRGKHAGEEIPMCGVPIHAAESYLERLIRKGFKVAICEQTEAPQAARKRGGKAIVARAVVRVVTKGTLTEDSLLEPGRNNYLAALARSQQVLGFAWLDVSTGELQTEPVADGGLSAALARIDPGELLAPEGLGEGELARDWADRLTTLPQQGFDSIAGERRLKTVFGVRELAGFGAFSRAELGAAGALLDYVELTQKGRMPGLRPPRRIEPGSQMTIDGATRRNLELLESLVGQREGSLLAAVDRTVTGAGARLLAGRLAAPLANAEAIRRRLHAVEALAEDDDLRAALRRALRGCPDLARALSRLSLGRGGPRDLAAIRDGLGRAHQIQELLEASASPLRKSAAGIADLAGLIAGLTAALVESPPVLARDGGFIRAGFQPELDQQRDLRDQGRRHVAQLEKHLQDETGIASLKVRHNNLLGYYIEVAATHRARVPAHFVQRQSMANATRYSTENLASLESRIAAAGERALALEGELFEGLSSEVLAERAGIGRTADTLARLDVAAGFAGLAVEEGYVRPEIDDTEAFEVVGGRHPVVEQALRTAGERFIANDADFSPERRLWLLTGPNMAGKSTFLRQNALIAVLAQAGSFVPAVRARIGVVDRLFSRVGAADDLARGRSTFMVEMVETAAILNQAGPKSLVILDEIGRGTATYDGLSIAWAVVEHLHEATRCRALFATHFHELTALAARLPRLAVRTMRVKEWEQQVIFLHEVAEGAADRSYGIHVARLAGLPEAVLARAEEVLHRLEADEARRAPARLADDLPLFAAAARSRPERTPSAEAEPSELEAAVRALDPDALTPREALDRLYDLVRLIDQDRSR
jgi:DNA mismatch repair protein MutS